MCTPVQYLSKCTQLHSSTVYISAVYFVRSAYILCKSLTGKVTSNYSCNRCSGVKSTVFPLKCSDVRKPGGTSEDTFSTFNPQTFRPAASTEV